MCLRMTVLSTYLREAGVFPEGITIRVLHVRAVSSFASLFGGVEIEGE